MSVYLNKDKISQEIFKTYDGNFSKTECRNLCFLKWLQNENNSKWLQQFAFTTKVSFKYCIFLSWLQVFQTVSASRTDNIFCLQFYWTNGRNGMQKRLIFILTTIAVKFADRPPMLHN